MTPGKDNKPDPTAPSDLEALQTAFAAHIRNPDANPVPDGIEDRRMKIYRELFFNNIQSLLAGNFPVLRKLYDEDGWQSLIRDFYARHRSMTPLFPEVAREFLRYLQDERESRGEDPPFLLELAHYEWVELALELDERELADVPAEADGDLLSGKPLLSPLAWPLTYRYPVHRISPGYQPRVAPAEATHILVYRNAGDDVKFMQLNPVSQLLLELMQQEPAMTGRELLQEVAVRIRHPDPEKVIAAGAELLAELKEKHIVLGTRGET